MTQSKKSVGGLNLLRRKQHHHPQRSVLGHCNSKGTDSSTNGSLYHLNSRTLFFLFLFWSGYSLFFSFSSSNKLRTKLKEISPLLETESTELLKNKYLEIYHFYLKLSEKNKRNFYSKVTELRERIEEHLQAEKRISELFLNADDGDLGDRKKAYLKIYNYYLKLPEKSRQKYYAHIVRLRDRLERGE